MRRRNIILVVVAVVAVAMLVIFKPKSKDSKAVAGSGRPGGGGPVSVQAILASEQRLTNDVYSTGTVQANEEVNIRPEITGRVISIHFKEGSKVNKGDLLIKLNDTDLRAQLQKLQSTKALNESNEFRAKKLMEIEGISRQEYESVQNQLSGVNADIDLIRAQMAKTEIRAPFPGVIGIRNVSEGSIVGPSDVIVSVQQIDPVKIDFSIPEKYINQVRVGDRIAFTIEGTDTSFTATVNAIEPKIDPTTRRVIIRAVCKNSDGKIYPGAFARVRLSLGEIENAILVPTQSVVPTQKGQNVYVVRGGKATPQPVETGIRNDTAVQILSGLNPNDTVITTGIMQLRPQTPVTVTLTNKS
jgi:membrane fusion protein (multidrug efflux system)